MDRVERSLPQLLIELLSLHRASVGLPELEFVIVFGMTNRAAIYARASPDCPLSLEEQLACLRCVATERGWTVGHIFMDRPTAVRKGHDRRPGEIAVINAIQSGAIDRVLVWSIDRIGKSLVELVGFMETCRLHDVSLWVEEQKLDTATSNGMSLFDLSTMMATHLRQSRRNRILRGQAAARRSVYQIWQAAAYQTEGGESQTRIPGCRQGRATGRPNGGDFPCVGVEDQDVD